jgi:hypothetical protein
MRRFAAAALLVFTVLGSTPRENNRAEAVGNFTLPDLPFLPGSIVPIALQGVTPPYDLDVLGPGRVSASAYYVPSDADGTATLVASGENEVAMRSLRFAPPPDPTRSFIAVATYDDGVVLHDADAPFARSAVLGVGGAPSDVAIDPDGSIGAAATNSNTAAIASLRPWHVNAVSDVPFVDEVAFDESTHALFATNRDINGVGAISRIMPDGAVRRRVLGLTAEGIAVDAQRRRVYVANVNDGTISIVDADSLVELRRIKAVDRVFSLALNADGSRLYATSNQSVTSPFASAGSAIALDLTRATPHIVARSTPLTFPVGIASDNQHHRVFVTDEHDDTVSVLSSQTLRPVHDPLRTCHTPWKPYLDEGRLYVPCAQANQVDVFDTHTLSRVHGAPFETGGYPLAVAVWHPHTLGKR